ncbi:hypothetical protein AB4Y89_24330 [Terriglobus sp. 2YAB30_2]|uniref:hypothetical protein n=1 Tax=Terriglobus sp. 2YAB30_2 TaxID=3233023 RepID=UPI003F9A9BBB
MMNVHKSMAIAILAVLATFGFSASTAEATPQVWGACGTSSPEDKVVAKYGKARLLCGNDKWGFRHIQEGHGTEWEQLAAIENRNWRDIADMAISKSLDNPDRTVNQAGGRTCYSGQIYLVNFATGAIATTIYPSIIVLSDGRIITAFPGGGCA